MDNKTGLVRALTIGGALLLCAACSQTSDETASPTSSDNQPSAVQNGATHGSTPTADNGAPKVPNPVNVARFKNDPCSTLTGSQLKTLGITVTGKVSEGLCHWEGGPDHPGVSVGFLPNPNGLSDIYGLARQHRFQEFAPVPAINGFPAVKAIIAVTPGNTDCDYDIGLTDKDVADVQVTNVSGGDSCNAVLQVARDVTITVKGAN